MQYKVLSLLQPWASLVVRGHKRIETRSWKTPYRGVILIHASKGQRKAYQNLCADENLPFGQFIDPYSYKCLPFGEIIGSVNLVDILNSEQCTSFFDKTHSLLEEHLSPEWLNACTPVEHAFGDYSPKRYGWRLTDPIEFKEPIPAKGNLGLWTPDLGLQTQIERQIAK